MSLINYPSETIQKDSDCGKNVTSRRIILMGLVRHQKNI
jgi:hypothetical protein